MVDSIAISKTVITGLKRRIFGKAKYGNSEWKKSSNEWYEKIHESNHLLHDDFISYFNKKISKIHSVLEVGCGTGIYPIKHNNLFQNLEYTGIDFSESNIEYCKSHSNFDFIGGNFIKMELGKKYDLVFSHAVIDHVYDIDTFLSNLIKSCKKYAYINSYRGYFPNLEQHQMKWKDEDNCYYNNISINQVKQVLLNNGLEEKEFIIRSQKSGQNEENLNLQLVIEIERADE